MNVKKITQIIEYEQSFSGTIQISQNQDILLSCAKGYAKMFDEIPNQIDTSFGIASGTKGFTALAILKLVDEGKLSLEDDVFKILPYDFPNVKETITVRHLLSHTSGIYDYFDEYVMDDFVEIFKAVPINKILGPTDMLPLLTAGECYFSPGDKFKYCNSAFVILGILIEVISKMKYADYLQENIIKPLGLTGTGCYQTNQLPKYSAEGYVQDENGDWASNIFEIPMTCTADGGLFTTVNDVAKMWNSFISGNLISEEIRQETLKKHVHMRENKYYGLGFYIVCDENENIKYYELVGSDPGVSFDSRYYVSDKKILTVISNNEDDVWKLAGAIDKHL